MTLRIRKSYLLKLRQAQPHSQFSLVHRLKGCAAFEAKNPKILFTEEDFSTFIGQHGCSKAYSSNKVYNTKAQPSFYPDTIFSRQHHKDHQNKNSQNFKHCRSSASSYPLSVLLLGFSAVVCQPSCDDEPCEKKQTEETKEHPTPLQIVSPCCSCGHCPSKAKCSDCCSVTHSNSDEQIHSNCAGCTTTSEDVASSNPFKNALTCEESFDKLEFQSHNPLYSEEIDGSCPRLEVNMTETNRKEQQRSPTTHMDGKSEGDSAYKKQVSNAVVLSTNMIKNKLLASGAIGASVAVMLNGKLVWAQGVGYCNFEHMTNCSAHSKYRIASISKSMTATMAMAMWEDGLLDLDAPITDYLKDWPKKTVDGNEVTITTRHLLTHSSGIRHYHLKNPEKKDTEDSKDTAAVSCMTGKMKNSISTRAPSLDKSDLQENLVVDDRRNDFEKLVESRREALKPQLNYYKFLNEKMKKKKQKEDGADLWEYYITKPYTSVQDAVDLFKDDELFFIPGSGFHYTSHGYTLLSRVMEAASGASFEQLAADFFHNIGLSRTRLDKPLAIIQQRVPCYERNSHHILQNAPYVDNSYKWAGGGFLSSAVDLVRFGSALLYSLHATDHMIQEHNVQPGFLKSSTVQKMWSPYFYHNPSKTFSSNYLNGYGLGWCIRVPRMDQYEKKSPLSSETTLGPNSAQNSKAEDDSFGPVTEWEFHDKRPSTVPDNPKIAQDKEAPETEAAHCMLPQGRNELSPKAKSHNLPRELPKMDAVVKNVSKAVTGPQEMPQDNIASKVLPECELESSGWVEGDAIGSRSCRGFCGGGWGFAAYHTGAAIGGSSILVIMPGTSGDWLVQKQESPDAAQSRNEPLSGESKKLKGAAEDGSSSTENHLKDSSKPSNSGHKKVPYRSIVAPKSSWNTCSLCHRKLDEEIQANSKVREPAQIEGVVVAILTNCTGVSFREEAFSIAREFSAIKS